MQLALWDILPGDLLAYGFQEEQEKLIFDVERRSSRVCNDLLLAGQVDIAMIPAVTLLKDVSSYDVYPVLALSSWAYPFVKLVLKDEFKQPVSDVAYPRGYDQELFLAQLILKEHYQQQATFTGYNDLSNEEMLALDERTCLIIGEDVPDLSFTGLGMDLGQEWYELANYPFVWAFFVSRKGMAKIPWIEALQAAAERIDQGKSQWAHHCKFSNSLLSFFDENIRTRLDDLARASITELQQFLFYFDIIEEIHDISFVYLNE